MKPHRFLTVTAAVLWAWSALGVVLAYTVAPGAINMAIGVGIGALVWTGLTLFERKLSQAPAPALTHGERVSNTVDHPAHYTGHPSGIECIQVTEHMGFNLGNAVKYVWRADLKGNAIEDLRKARWYLDREIERRERTAATPS